MSAMTLAWEEGFRFTGTDSWDNTIAIDAEQGSGGGAKPSDMLALSLAACTAYDVVNILRKQRQDLQGLDAEIQALQEPDAPWAFTKIRVVYTVRGEVDPRKAEKALALSEEKYCSVAATLRPVVELDFSIVVA